MAISRVLVAFTIVIFQVSMILPCIHADSIVSPAPAPSNDGTSIDQGIAYALMLVALAVTYLMH